LVLAEAGLTKAADSIISVAPETLIPPTFGTFSKTLFLVYWVLD